MQFHRIPRAQPRQVSGRMIAAYARSCRAQRDKLPLFADQIAATQRPVAEEMARRQANDIIAEKTNRDHRAALWRQVRARLFSLPASQRAAVLDYFHGSRWLPRTPSMLATIIWQEIAALPYDAAEVAPYDPTARADLVRDFNDRARAGDSFTRARRAYSPGAMSWLAPGFEPDAEHARPAIHLHTSRGRWSLLWHAVAAYDGFNHNADPAGERRAGHLEVMGAAFHFEIFYQSPADDLIASAAPWNLDLSRRAIWIGLADERPDLAAATFESGWTHQPRT